MVIPGEALLIFFWVSSPASNFHGGVKALEACAVELAP